MISGFRKYWDVFGYSDPNIEEFIGNFQQAIKLKQKDKKNKLGFCDNKMQQAERNAERESIRKIEAYKKVEKHIWKDIFNVRTTNEGADHFDYYASQEAKLIELIAELKGDLLDIEMALKQTLDAACSQYFNEIKKINEEMHGLTAEVFVNISGEFLQFSIKLKEELNKEKEQTIARIESDEDTQNILDDYNCESMENPLGTALEIILEENKDAVDELVTTFIEKIENEAGNKESLITKGRNTEWSQKQQELIDKQFQRSREIICEAIEVT